MNFGVQVITAKELLEVERMFKLNQCSQDLLMMQLLSSLLIWMFTKIMLVQSLRMVSFINGDSMDSEDAVSETETRICFNLNSGNQRK